MSMKRKTFILENFGFRVTIFIEQAFSEEQPSQDNFCLLLVFLLLSKIKSHIIKVIGDEKSVKLIKYKNMKI